MAKIIKVESSTVTPKVNLFKTSRNSATNPFKYSNFEGNTLQFADVFEGFEPKNTSRMKIIAASVAGSMNKIKNVFEPVINFAKRVSDAWTYAKNTNISDIPAIKSLNEIMNKPIEIKLLNDISSSITGMKSGISDKVGVINSEVTNLCKGLGDRWHSLISTIQTKKITSDMSVAELETLLREELSKDIKGAA